MSLIIHADIYILQFIVDLRDNGSNFLSAIFSRSWSHSPV